MIELHSDFYFRGDRDYVFFPTVFEVFRKTVTQYCGDTTSCMSIKNYKIHKKVINNSLIKIYNIPELEGLKHKENLIAEMQCSIDNTAYFVGLYDENSTIITKRIEAIEKELVGQIQQRSPYSGFCNKIKFRNNYELIQACCETNKRLHLMSLPASELPKNVISVMLMEYICQNQIVAFEARLDICNIGVWENNNHIFTCNLLELDIKGQKRTCRLFYSIRKRV